MPNAHILASPGRDRSSSESESSDLVLRLTETIGDTIVSSCLLEAPNRRANKRRWFLLCLSVLFAVVSVAAFTKGIVHAKSNHAAKTRWIDVGRKPLADFRPQRLSMGYELGALGGLAGLIGCVVLLLGGRPRRPEKIFSDGFIGNSWSGQNPLDLVRVVDLHYASLTVPAGARGVEMGADGGESILAGTLPIRRELGRIWRLEHGIGRLHIEWVVAPRATPVAGWLATDSRLMWYVAGSVLTHLVLLALLYQVPPEHSMLVNERMGTDALLSQLTDEAREEILPDEPEETNNGGTGSDDVMPAAISHGQMGSPRVHRNQRSRAQIAKRSEMIQLARHRLTIEDVTSIGILGVIGDQSFYQSSNDNDFTSGLDSDNMIGNSMVGTVGEGGGPGGSWGNATRFGINPYGTDWGTIAGDKIAIRDPGQDRFNWGARGSGVSLKRPTQSPTVGANCGTQCVAGRHSKSVIARIIRQQKRRIRNCYERALLGTPDLRATAMAHFLISPTGKVLGLSVRGTGHGGLESCIAKVIQTLQFPAVPDGGMANVRYPFILAPAGG